MLNVATCWGTAVEILCQRTTIPASDWSNELSNTEKVVGMLCESSHERLNCGRLYQFSVSAKTKYFRIKKKLWLFTETEAVMLKLIVELEDPIKTVNFCPTQKMSLR